MASDITVLKTEHADAGKLRPLPQRHLAPGLCDLLRVFIPTGSRCLDVGGKSQGALRRQLAERGCAYIRADASEATRLQFDQASFDAAILLDALEWLPDPRSAAEELYRVLRPGGVLLVVVANAGYWRRRLDRSLRGQDQPGHTFGPSSLRHLLLQAGFGMVGVEGQDGAIIRDLPLAGRLWKRDASAAYRRAERLLPSLLGSRIGAFAIRS